MTLLLSGRPINRGMLSLEVSQGEKVHVPTRRVEVRPIQPRPMLPDTCSLSYPEDRSVVASRQHAHTAASPRTGGYL